MFENFTHMDFNYKFGENLTSYDNIRSGKRSY